MLHIRLHCGHGFGDRIAQRDLLLSGQEQRTQMEGPQTKWMCQHDLEPNTAAFVHPKMAPLSLSLLGEPCKRWPRFSFLSVSRIRQKGTPPKKKDQKGATQKQTKKGATQKKKTRRPQIGSSPRVFFVLFPVGGGRRAPRGRRWQPLQGAALLRGEDRGLHGGAHPVGVSAAVHELPRRRKSQKVLLILLGWFFGLSLVG